jgi:hypothetical protein
MSKERLHNLENQLPAPIGHAVEEVDRAVHDFAQHVHLSHWHPVSTAPANQALELRFEENGSIKTLDFPCLQTNDGVWINVDLGTEIDILPLEWRVWQHTKSPQPHRTKINSHDRSALFHHSRPDTDQTTKVDDP